MVNPRQYVLGRLEPLETEFASAPTARRQHMRHSRRAFFLLNLQLTSVGVALNIAGNAFVTWYPFASFIPLGGIRKLHTDVRLPKLLMAAMVLLAVQMFCLAQPSSRASIDLCQFSTGQFG